MRIDDMDEATVQYAYAYGEWQYQQGYEAGKKDAVKGLEDSRDKQPLSTTEAFKGHCLHCFQEGYEQGKKDAVKHGYWILKNSIGSAVCSECGGVIYNAYDNNSNKYCHICGAKMDGDVNETD